MELDDSLGERDEARMLRHLGVLLGGRWRLWGRPAPRRRTDVGARARKTDRPVGGLPVSRICAGSALHEAGHRSIRIARRGSIDNRRGRPYRSRNHSLGRPNGPGAACERKSGCVDDDHRFCWFHDLLRHGPSPWPRRSVPGDGISSTVDGRSNSSLTRTSFLARGSSTSAPGWDR